MKLWTLVFFLFTASRLAGQYYNPVNYTINNGLPSSEVYHIIQTEDGYIWFATDRGICRYNGYEFESFSSEDGLPDNTVFRFFPQKDGKIWCTTLSNKLFSFDSDLVFEHHPQNHLISQEVNNAIPSDLFFHEKDMFISFKGLNGYLKVSNQGTLSNNTSGYQDEKVLVFERISQGGFAYSLDQSIDFKPIFEGSEVLLHETKNGNAINILALRNTTIVADHKDVYFYNNGLPYPLELDNYPLAVGKLDEDHFWVGYRFGGFKIYANNGELVLSELQDESVTSLCIDHERGLWVSTLNSGVYYYRFNQIQPSLVDESASNSVTDITIDDSNQVYVAYADGNVMKWSKGLYSALFKGQRKSMAKVQYYESLGGVIVNSDHVQFLSSNPDSTFFHHRAILSFDENQAHTPAHGSHASFCIGLNKEKENAVPFRVNDLTPYNNGYFLASNIGLFYYDTDSDTVNRFAPNYNYRFRDIDLLNGSYYAGSMGYGLFIYSPDSFVSIKERDGLFSNMISQVTIENDSVVWVCTNKGLNRVELRSDGSKHINGVSLADGLLSNETVDVEISHDTVWVGTKLGLCHFPKSLLEEHKAPFPNYYLTLQKITVNDSGIDPEEINHLNHSENNIEFFFQAISYNSDLQYRYKLEGLDNKWYSTDRLSVRYPSIPPGSYNFQVQVLNASFPDETNHISLPFYISPPFYNTWWFYLLLVSTVSGLIYLFFKLYIFTYNKDVVRELLRHLLKRIKLKDKYVVLRMNGKDIRVVSSKITYIKAAGNYLDVHTVEGKYTIRCKISEFLSLVPDPIEFIQVHRSYIVRIDRITKKDSKMISIGDIAIPITKSFKAASQKIQF